mmetsp:Transcript_15601/g.38634  ORF Transcript_15601/g.38634 Transcript_15601/m.38634 type:complete len:555 (-) Transcript_15601:2818-4482(-)
MRLGKQVPRRAARGGLMFPAAFLKVSRVSPPTSLTIFPAEEVLLREPPHYIFSRAGHLQRGPPNISSSTSTRSLILDMPPLLEVREQPWDQRHDVPVVPLGEKPRDFRVVVRAEPPAEEQQVADLVLPPRDRVVQSVLPEQVDSVHVVVGEQKPARTQQRGQSRSSRCRRSCRGYFCAYRHAPDIPTIAPGLVELAQQDFDDAHEPHAAGGGQEGAPVLVTEVNQIKQQLPINRRIRVLWVDDQLAKVLRHARIGIGWMVVACLVRLLLRNKRCMLLGKTPSGCGSPNSGLLPPNWWGHVQHLRTSLTSVPPKILAPDTRLRPLHAAALPVVGLRTTNRGDAAVYRITSPKRRTRQWDVFRRVPRVFLPADQAVRTVAPRTVGTPVVDAAALDQQTQLREDFQNHTLPPLVDRVHEDTVAAATRVLEQRKLDLLLFPIRSAPAFFFIIHRSLPHVLPAGGQLPEVKVAVRVARDVHRTHLRLVFARSDSINFYRRWRFARRDGAPPVHFLRRLQAELEQQGEHAAVVRVHRVEQTAVALPVVRVGARDLGRVTG